MKSLSQLITVLTLILATNPAWAQPLVVTSIRPLTMIVQAIGGDQVEVRQLLPDTEEPHHYSLRISDRLLLNQADLVIWVGPELESFLVRAIANQNPEKVVTAISLPDMQKAADPKITDPHLWLNPENGAVLAIEVANSLATHFPELQKHLLANLQQFRVATQATKKAIHQQLATTKKSGILVDHDAFGHFFQAFDIKQIGALKTPSGLPASAGSLQAVLSEGAIDCIVIEPQSAHTRVKKIAAKTTSRTVTIDPLGADILDSNDAYQNLLRGIAAGLQECLPSLNPPPSDEPATPTPETDAN